MARLRARKIIYVFIAVFFVTLSLLTNTACEKSAAASSWEIQTVDTAQDSWLILDSDGNPHICYYNDGVKIASWNNSSWNIQTVAQSEYPIFDMQSCSLKFDSKGYLHMLYAIGWLDINTLYYTHWNGTSWDLQRIAYETSGGDLALDSADKPHISYACYGKLYYYSWTNSSGVPQSIDYATNGGHLVFDKNGNPHITYTDDHKLKYAFRTGVTWIKQVIDDNGHLGLYTFDSKSTPAICYVDREFYLKYAKMAGSSWSTQIIDTAQWGSFDFDSSDNPNICYLDNQFNLKYAKWTGLNWNIETIDSASDFHLDWIQKTANT
jgi:hypothetical protein